MVKEVTEWKVVLDYQQTKNGLQQIATSTRKVNTEFGKASTTIRTVNGQFKGMTKTFSSGTKGMKKQAGVLGKLKGELRGVMFQYIGVQAVVSGLVQGSRRLVEWIRNSIKEFKDFEYALSEVSTLIGDKSKTAIVEYEDSIESMATTFGQTVNDLTEGIYQIVSASVALEEAPRLLEIATKASIAGVTDVATSVDVFTSILNAYGMSVEEMTTISDQLFQTIRVGKLRFEDLAAAMGYIAPISASLGVEFKEIAAALSTVTRQGQHTDMATRGLALGIQNIADISPAAASAAENFGVDLSAVALRVGGLKEIIEDLNAAMRVHGSAILPQMIRNMRSLRVFMALTSEEGITGFMRDLQNLNEVQGETDKAMQKVINTRQMWTRVTEENTKVMERSIGEAWSGVDLMLKRWHLWWAALVAGEDATEAVKEMQKGLFDNAIASLNEVEHEDFDLYDAIKGKETEEIATIIQDAYDWDAIFRMKELEGVHSRIMSIESDITTGTKLMSETLLGGFETENIWRDLSNILAPVVGLPQIEVGIEFDKDTQRKRLNQFISGVNEDLRGTELEPFTIDLIDEDPTKEEIEGIREQWNNLKEEIDTREFELEDGTILTWEELKQQFNEGGEALNSFKGDMAGMERELQNIEMNILQLRNAIRGLRVEVEDDYEVLTGDIFKGKLEWEIEVLGAETAIDRLQRLADMAIKYGDDFDIDTIQKQLPEGFEALNDEIWNSVKANNDYSGSFNDLINSMGDYEEAQKEMNKAQKEYNDFMEKYRLELLKLNLQIQEIQLKGMMRRRGLTRSEQKTIDKLRIEQTKQRIAQMKEEIDFKETQQEEMVSTDEDMFSQMESIYNEYVARVNFNLAELKDGRNSDIEDMEQTLEYKRGLLTKYEGWLSEELGKYETLWEGYRNTVELLAGDEEWQKSLRKALGYDTAMEVQDYINQIDIRGAETIHGAESEEASEARKKAAPLSFMMETVGRMPENVRDVFMRSFPEGSFKRGTDYIPADGLYKLHRGEQVVNRQSGGGDIIVQVNVSGNQITQETLPNVARQVGDAASKALVDKRTGKSKYRLR